MVAILMASVGAYADESQAGCNVIPAASRSFPSERGRVTSPIALPGRPIEIRLTPCDPVGGGFDRFDAVAAKNIVTLTFEPPGPGADTPVVVPAGNVTVDECVGSACDILRFPVPDTDAEVGLPADGLGLAGPAHIVVQHQDDGDVLAEIKTLFQPTTTCDKEPETVFRQLTILPPSNDDAALASGGSTRVLMTVDGDGNLLVPLFHEDVLPADTPEAPAARLLSGQTVYAGFATPRCTLTRATVCAGDVDCPVGETCDFAIAGAPIVIPASEYIRSFTPDGRPLPPLLRVTATGDIVGTTDARESVLRIVRNDGAGGADIFDVTDRLEQGKGPIVIDQDFGMQLCTPLPLSGLHASTDVVTFARDESIEDLDLNGDTDKNDRVVQTVDLASGGCGTSTSEAIAEPATWQVTDQILKDVPALATDGDIVAYLASEVGQGQDLNGDGDQIDSILRVRDGAGTDLTGGASIAVEQAFQVNRRSLAVEPPLVFARRPAGGTLRREVIANGDWIGGATGIGVRDAAFSPDGRNVYLAGHRAPGLGGALHAYTRTRDVSYALYDIDVAAGFEGASSVAVSPECLTVYVTGAIDDNLAVFARDAATGGLTFVEAEYDGVGGVTGLDGPSDVVVAPDGLHVYVAAEASSSVAVFARDPGTGALTFVEVQVDGAGGIDGLAGPTALDTSPDGAHLYVAGSADDSIAVFSRNVGTGALTFVERALDGAAGVDGLASARSVKVSPDGSHVYAVGHGEQAVAAFSRNGGTGQLTFIQAIFDGDGGVDGLAGAFSLAIAPDGNQVYVASGFVGGGGDDALAVFDRDAGTGALTFVKAEPALENGPVVTVAPEGSDVLVSATQLLFDDRSAIVRFEYPAELVVLDTGTQSLRPGPFPRVEAVTTSGQHAILLVPEDDVAGTQLNNDTDSQDQVAYLYTYGGLGADTLTNLGVAVDRPAAIAGNLVALAIDELSQNQEEWSGDSDYSDAALALWTIGGPLPPIKTLIELPRNGVYGNSPYPWDLAIGDSAEGPNTRVVFVSGEIFSPPNEWNGDDDDGDGLLRIIDVAPLTPPFTARPGPRLAAAFEKPTVEGSLVAFRVEESNEGPTGSDLNGDGDILDQVMYVYDMLDDRVLATGQAARPCGLPACESKVPIKIVGDMVAFVTYEPDQGNRDLNGDGDAVDYVAQIFNVSSRKVTVIGTPASAESRSPFPEKQFGGTVVYTEVNEGTLGLDVNGDGDTNDVVLTVGSDNDDDGTLDDDDSCVEAPNPTQKDSDLDGLGDNTCDPTTFCGDYVPGTPPLAPPGAAACQAGIGKATRTYLGQRASAVRSCLDKIAKGKAVGDPTTFCRGGFVAGLEIPPADHKTVLKLAKARDKFVDMVLKECPGGEVGVLDTCGVTTADLETCALPAYGAVVTDTTDLAYGELVSIGDTAARKCQLAIGNAVRSYVSTLVKTMHGCLDVANAEALPNGQVVCLGRIDSMLGVVEPTNLKASAAVQKAEQKLRDAVTKKCTAGTLATLDVCGGLTATSAVGDCLACTGYRRALGAVAAAYGPPS